jgi:hypothetical protein
MILIPKKDHVALERIPNVEFINPGLSVDGGQRIQLQILNRALAKALDEEHLRGANDEHTHDTSIGQAAFANALSRRLRAVVSQVDDKQQHTAMLGYGSDPEAEQTNLSQAEAPQDPQVDPGDLQYSDDDIALLEHLGELDLA